MRLRTVLTSLSATVLLAGSAAVPAVSARAVPSGCTIRDFSPHEIVIGAEPTKDVRFSLDTTCPVEDDVNWYLRVQHEPGPYGFLMRANFFQSPATRYGYAPDGVVRMDQPGNGLSGPNDIWFGAFLGDTYHAQNPMDITGTLILKRATRLQDSYALGLTAEPGTVPKNGTVTLRTKLQRVDWDAGEYDDPWAGYAGAPVVVEFRGDNNARYQPVKTVQSAADGSVTTTVTATKTGTWRMRFTGDGTSGASKSVENYVSVTR